MHALFYIFIIACVYCFVNWILMFIINFLILNEYKLSFTKTQKDSEKAGLPRVLQSTEKTCLNILYPILPPEAAYSP